MGLDTSHGCWSGPYSAFNRWREFISYCEMKARGERGDEAAKIISHGGHTNEAYTKALTDGHYDDQSVPINVLLAHPDCEGDIPAEMCGPIADALAAHAERFMPPRALYDEKRPATERFIAGLREAAAAGEAVEFG